MQIGCEPMTHYKFRVQRIIFTRLRQSFLGSRFPSSPGFFVFKAEVPKRAASLVLRQVSLSSDSITNALYIEIYLRYYVLLHCIGPEDYAAQRCFVDE